MDARRLKKKAYFIRNPRHFIYLFLFLIMLFLFILFCFYNTSKFPNFLLLFSYNIIDIFGNRAVKLVQIFIIIK